MSAEATALLVPPPVTIVIFCNCAPEIRNGPSDGGVRRPVRVVDTPAWFSIPSRTTQGRCWPDIVDFPRCTRDGKFVYFNNFYFNGKGRKGGIKRWNRETNTVESLLKFPDSLLTGAYGITFSLTPDNSIILLKDISSRDLYALDLDLP